MATPPSISGSDAAPFRVTKSVTGVIRKLSADALTIEDAKSGKAVDLVLAAGKRLRVSGAAKQIADLRQGATVRVNYAAGAAEALDIRVIENGK